MTGWQPLPVPASRLGESPFWHPDEAALYWCDIAGRSVHRWRPEGALHDRWDFEAEPGSCAPLAGGAGLLVACRDGLYRLDPRDGSRRRLAAAPYDTASERFNDGKADPQGRFWVGTLHEPRTPRGALYRWSGGRLDPVVGGVATSNGLAFSPDGRTMYWADTAAHRIHALDFDGADGSVSQRRVFAEFPLRQTGADAPPYAGRPDGAAVDAEGAYWVAMYEGQQLLRLAPDGALLQALPLPVRCPTMPCFGGADLRTLYVTTARERRPAEELAAQPWAGCVLATRVPVPGLPVHFAAA